MHLPLCTLFQAGQTPSYLAASQGKTEALAALIASGANVNIQDEVFNQVLIVALLKCMPYLVQGQETCLIRFLLPCCGNALSFGLIFLLEKWFRCFDGLTFLLRL